MEKLGVTHLNYYIGTHAHSDHVGAACSLLTRTPADEILYTYSLAVDCMLDSARHGGGKARDSRNAAAHAGLRRRVHRGRRPRSA